MGCSQVLLHSCHVSGGLQDALDLGAGGEIAMRLNALYDYMNRRLLEATLRDDDTLIIEVDALLANLEDAWKSISPDVAPPLTAAEV